ncbi:hypothetical protein [Polaromonas sp.]|uniref:hypothetical protein n=1 Tax=Polaromonas sp. TaxID=1869339 RepID=UPI00352ACD9B
MNISRFAFVFGIALVTAGCASQLLSDDRLRSQTAPLVGANVSDVAISDRREEGTNTYYTAKTSAGEFTCSINGGNIFAAGLTQGGQCTKKAVAPKAAPTPAARPAVKK